MTSKSLFWAEWKENVKRRTWTFALCLVVMLFAFPVLQMMDLSRRQSGIENMTANGAGRPEIERALEDMRTAFASGIGFSDIFVWIALLFAVLFAVQGFSFLYDRRKMDLYMSVPVSGTKRFWLIWANGAAAFGLSYLFSLLLSWCVGAAYGVMGVEQMADSLIAYFVNLLAFIAIYQVALLAVMVTGNVMTALLGCGALFFYEFAFRYLIQGLKSLYFASYCRADADRWMERFWLTPLQGYGSFAGEIRYQNGGIAGYGREAGWCSSLMGEVLTLAVTALILGALVYLLYRKRKTESYNETIVFAALKPAAELLILIPFGMGVGAMAGRYTGNQKAFLFVGAVCAALLGHAVIQLIYERELKAAVTKKVLALVCAVSAAALLSVFRFDLFGYDSYLPKRDKIESICVTLEHDYQNFGQENLSSIGYDKPTAWERLLEEMNSTDPATIDAVLEMASVWQEKGWWDKERNGMPTEDTIFSDAQCYVVRYRLKSGRSVYRRFFADGSVTPEALNTVLANPDYRKVRYQINSQEFAENLDRMKITYDDGMQEYLYTMDAKKLLEAYRKEFAGYDYDMIAGSLPCGRLIFTIEREESYNLKWTYPVYEEFGEVIWMLSENGIPAGQREYFLPVEDVKEIRISYDIYSGEEGGGSLFQDEKLPSQTIVCSFEDPEEIRQIAKALYSTKMMDVAGREFGGKEFNYEFSVSVSMTAEGQRKHYDASKVYFLADQVPEVVKNKIREAAVSE